jgi:hypothetical protein
MWHDDDDQNEGGNEDHGLKPGTFRARATAAVLAESGNGNPQIAISFQILDEAFAGSTIPYYGSFSKNLGKGKKTPFQRTIEALRLCGWEGDDLSDLSTVTANEVSLVLDFEEFEGEKKLKVKWVNAPGGVAVKNPMNEVQAKGFAARMRGEIIAASKKIAKPANGGGSAKKPPADDPMDFPPREDEGY